MIASRLRAAASLVAAVGMLAAVTTGCSSGEPAASATSPSTTATSTAAQQTGDCIRLIMAVDLAGGSHDSTETVECDTKHHGEVVLADPQFFSGDEELPGEDELALRTDAVCADAMETYSGKRPEQTSYRMMVLYPSEATWEGGDRSLTCIAVAYDMEFDAFAEVEGSIRAA